mmetsp:Transcript_911/g.1995  ORF Transcript_911/g.1995 Transcript_911/m.1995 type:complete len:202 (-) Transcript_911:39-644(-)
MFRQDPRRGRLLVGLPSRSRSRFFFRKPHPDGRLQPRQGPTGRRQEPHARDHRCRLSGAVEEKERQRQHYRIRRPDPLAGKALPRCLRDRSVLDRSRRRRKHRQIEGGHGRRCPRNGRDGSHGDRDRFRLGGTRRNPQPGHTRRIAVVRRERLRGRARELQRAFRNDLRAGKEGFTDRCLAAFPVVNRTKRTELHHRETHP